MGILSARTATIRCDPRFIRGLKRLGLWKPNSAYAAFIQAAEKARAGHEAAGHEVEGTRDHWRCLTCSRANPDHA